MPRRTSRDIRSDSMIDVLHAVLSAGETTRNDLMRSTGLSPATVVTIVNELIEADVLAETKVSAGRVGRPTSIFGMNAARGRILGIDVAETYVRATMFDTALNQVSYTESARDEHVLEPGSIVETIGLVVDELLQSEGVCREGVLGAGISLPGLIQEPSGMAVVVPNWEWRSVELDRLRERVGLPLVIDNPLKAMVNAERWLGRGRSAASLATVNLGTGVGAGIVLEGEVLRGATNSAGEWGHSLLMLDGRLCRCGRRGCVEAYIGVPGIQHTLRELAPSHPLADVELQSDFISLLAHAAESSTPDDAARETVARTAYYLGSALADLVAVVNPDVVTLTGWTTWALGGQLLSPARERMRSQSPGRAGAAVELEISAVRGNPVVTGIAMIALERSLVDAGLLTTRIPVVL
ncbi:ROK family transcriptional regulator [Microbacterium suwonense]|uniref:Sugar kinase n=1 Tax=Microbacterium suwonense TaxID=683047 RepID=A0ABM8FVF3_9MICO|nr:ROK family transcriptional regulator [Microbacterium suwonense]BDZ39502.1 sugar kinase [Microbacterium suwonense]